MLDLSEPAAEGQDLHDYSQADNGKSALVFVDAVMLEEKLDPKLPLAKLWLAALRAHGINANKHFGGDRIIVLSMGISLIP